MGVQMNKKTTDFSKILEELRAIGLNDYRMAELTGLDRSILTKLRSGNMKQPNYDAGAAIMEIYSTEILDKDK